MAEFKLGHGIQMTTLNIAFDPNIDMVVIEGNKFSGDMFRENGFNAAIGTVLRIEKREDGVITFTNLYRCPVCDAELRKTHPAFEIHNAAYRDHG